jgi:hypothetical protein
MVSKTSPSRLKAPLKDQDFQEAAPDFRYLLNRGYPRKRALELVGNRYQLSLDERDLLHRGVFSQPDSTSRRHKVFPVKHLQNKKLAIDGHNVLITIEAGLEGRPLVLADDGFIRDISGASGNFRRTSVTDVALRLILDVLKKTNPKHTLFLLDAPISHSGKLAEEIRRQLERWNLPGDALAIKVPEELLIGFPGIISTSDTAIIDRSSRVADLAGFIIRRKVRSASVLRWKKRPSQA